MHRPGGHVKNHLPGCGIEHAQAIDHGELLALFRWEVVVNLNQALNFDVDLVKERRLEFCTPDDNPEAKSPFVALFSLLLKGNRWFQ